MAHPFGGRAGLRRRAGDTWRRALDVPHDVSLRQAHRLRADHPEATPEELVSLAAERFVRRVGVESSAVGAAAVYPGLGTAASAAASGAQLAAFVSEAALFTLVAAHLHGIDLRDPAKRTALVLAALTGRRGAERLTASLGIQTVAWFRTSFLSIRTGAAQQFNLVMTSWLRRHVVSRAATSTLGRALPFGAGALVGWRMGRAMADSVVEGVALALGPAPLAFLDSPLVVDVRLADTPTAVRFESLPMAPGARRGPDPVDEGAPGAADA